MKYERPQGFTLVEMSIVLVITGLLLASLSHGMSIYARQESKTKTVKALDTVQLAITDFRINYGYYPCPADPSAKPSSPKYGVADCNASGVKRVTGRDADKDSAHQPDSIVIGAVPFKTLLAPKTTGGTDSIHSPLPSSQTYDAWGHKLTYAITESLTKSGDGYNDFWGAIDVKDEHEKSVLAEPGTAHFVLLSHGDDGRGAYTENGAMVGTCAVVTTPIDPLAPATIPKLDETENCDRIDGTFLSGLRNETSDHYNDDILRFQMSQFSDLWSFAGSDGNQAYNTNPGNVGVGVDSPTQKLDIAGDMKAPIVRASGFCDETGSNCMPPAVIGGELEAMRCPLGQAIVSIEKNQVHCAPIFKPTLTACPDGPPKQYMVGISNITGIICKELP